MIPRSAVPYEKLKKIRVILLDVDGILTDGRIILGTDGAGGMVESKAFNAYDGQGLIFAGQFGYEIGLVTSRKSPIVARRAKELSIPHVFQNAKEKLPVVRRFMSGRRRPMSELLYMGDDFLDLPVLLKAGFSATVPDAPHEIRRRVDYVTDAKGGDGAVREVLDMLFKSRGQWPKLMGKFLRPARK